MAPPLGVSLSTSTRALGAACRPDGTLLFAVLGDGVLSVTQRSARRGEGFRGSPARISEGVSEAAVLRDPQEPVVVWRRASGPPFGAARLSAPSEPLTLSLGAWRAEQFRGVWPLRVERDAVWLASNLLVAGAPRAVVVRLPTNAQEPPTAFRLGDVSLLATIAGPAATLLVQGDGALSAVTVATTALSVLSSDAGAPATSDEVAARTVPLEALPRSEAWRAPTRWVLAAPEGVAVPGGARHFVVTAVDEPLPAGCDATRCAARGAVHALAFADRGPPSDTRLAERGLASALARDADGGRRFVGLGASGNGTTVWSVDTSNAVSVVELQGASTPSTLVACGDELWIAHDESPPRLACSPLPCALLHRQ